MVLLLSSFSRALSRWSGRYDLETYELARKKLLRRSRRTGWGRGEVGWMRNAVAVVKLRLASIVWQ